MHSRTLIVCCHATPHTKGGMLVQALRDALTEARIEHRISDLSSAGFNAIAGPADFRSTLPAQEDYRASQKLAARLDGFAPDIAHEQNNLRWADNVILVFPLWFFGMPALLKGWVERVMARGFAYGGDMEYATGGMAGKTAHALITAAADREDYTEHGKHVPLDMLLRMAFDLPMRYVGFQLGMREVLCAVERHEPEAFRSRAGTEARTLAALIASTNGNRVHETSISG